MKFIYLKSRESLEDEIPFIIEVLGKVINIINFISEDTELIIYYDYASESIEEITNIIASDIYKQITLYESIEYLDNDYLNRALKLVKTLFKENYFKENYLNNKLLLEYYYNKKTETIKKLVLANYYNDLEMYKTIIVFLEENQNASAASKTLFLHRNTLNQRLDKFYDRTGFNVKVFLDANLIYNLIK